MVGYLSFLKVGPSLLRFIPGKKAGDLAAWLTIYGSWNGSGRANVRTMLVYLADTYLSAGGGEGEVRDQRKWRGVGRSDGHARARRSSIPSLPTQNTLSLSHPLLSP